MLRITRLPRLAMFLSLFLVIPLIASCSLIPQFEWPDEDEFPPIETPAAELSGYFEHPVTIGEGDWQVNGSLCLPDEADFTAPYPVIMILGDSGPSDMNGSLYRNLPLQDIARGLAGHGVASLRYNKITKENSKFLDAMGDDLTLQMEYIPNAVDALAFLAKDNRLDPTRIFALGHGLGGMVLPRLHQASSLPAGYVFLAAGNTFLADELFRQYHYLFALDGEVDTDEQMTLNHVGSEVSRLHEMLDGTIEAKGPILGAPFGYWKEHKDNDPLVSAADIDLPVLILQGERDFSVLPESAERWQQAIVKADDVTLIRYPELNHQMLPGTGMDDPVDLLNARKVDPGVIKDLANWVLER